MAWTMSGVVISDEHGWTAAANAYVPKLKKWAGGIKHSGGAGRTNRPYHVIMRTLAENAAALRKRSAKKQ